MTPGLLATISPGEARLVFFLACLLAALALGYAARRTGLLRPERAGLIMSVAIVGVDAPVALVALWFLKIQADVWKVPVVGLLVAIATILIGLALARRLPAADRIVVALQGGMGNVGYTMGGAMALALWNVQGLAVEQMFCMMWPFFTFLFCFPLAHHYAGSTTRAEGGDAAYAIRLLGRSLADIRSLPLYLATLGLILNLMDVSPPQWFIQWHLLDALMLTGILMQFGAIGLTVQVRRLPRFWRPALGSAALKFLLSPALMLAAALAFGLTGQPLYVCLVLSAMPTALYSVLIANVFRFDCDLATTTCLLTLLLSLVFGVPTLALLARAGLLG